MGPRAGEGGRGPKPGEGARGPLPGGCQGSTPWRGVLPMPPSPEPRAIPTWAAHDSGGWESRRIHSCAGACLLGRCSVQIEPLSPGPGTRGRDQTLAHGGETRPGHMGASPITCARSCEKTASLAPWPSLTVPFHGAIAPAMVLSRVLFPAPLGPSTNTRCPFWMVTLMPAQASRVRGEVQDSEGGTQAGLGPQSFYTVAPLLGRAGSADVGV